MRLLLSVAASLVCTTALAGTLQSPLGGGFGAPLATGDVDADGDTDLVVAAPRSRQGRGAVYLFEGGPAGPAATPSWSMSCPQAGAGCGNALALVDVDADGFDDLLLGAPLYDGPGADAGSVFVIPGTPAGLSAAPSAVLAGSVAVGTFGASIASAGDVNGDGFQDVLVGAPLQSGDVLSEGSVHLYLGSAAGLVTPAAQVLQDGDQNQAYFGATLSGVGDVDGDGYDDVVIGASEHDDAYTNVGAAYVYLGSPAGLGPLAWSVVGDQSYGYLGLAVGRAGDVDGDGYADVMVASSAYDAVAWNEGRVDVYLGSAAGLAAAPDQTLIGDAFARSLGTAVVPLGDTDGDGFDDVLLGRQGEAALCEAGAEVHLGSASGLDPVASLVVTDPACTVLNGTQLGATAAAGDLDGNGVVDVIVGGIVNLVLYELF